MNSSVQASQPAASTHPHAGHGDGASATASNGARPACACSRLTWPRRWHALAGGIIMLFLLVHLGACMLGLRPAAYAGAVGLLESVQALAPALVVGAIFFVFLFQMITGVFLLNHHGMKYNVNKCNRGGKLRFFLQRTSAIALIAFLLLHVATLHAWGLHTLYRLTGWGLLARWNGGGLFLPGAAAFSSTVEGLSLAWGAGHGAWNLFLALFTLLGALSAAYHAANGLWSGAIVWKLAPTAASKRILGGLTLLAGAVFALLGCLAWWSFTFAPAARAALGR